MTQAIRVGVVGVGHLGRFHAQKYAAMEQVHLVGLADTDQARAEAVAAEVGCAALTDFRELASQVDAVSIATPTTSHFEVGRYCLEHGLDVMMEKPVTSTLDEADRLVRLAAERGRILQVGLIERFNPVMRAAEPHFTQPLFIEARRMGPFTRRGTDVDVVIDLMIHDLDIILSLVGSPVQTLSAAGAAVLTAHTDIANAHIVFANGCTANITVSRVSQAVERRMRVFQPGEYLSIDFHAKTCGSTRLTVDGATESPVFSVSDHTVVPADALEQELLDFVRCVRTRRPPTVTGAQGRDALAVALAVVEAIRENTRQLATTLQAAGMGMPLVSTTG